MVISDVFFLIYFRLFNSTCFCYIFPIIALFCNVVVVSGNCFNYIKSGNLNIKLLIPYLIGSIPLAFIGGSLTINKDFFEIKYV